MYAPYTSSAGAPHPPAYLSREPQPVAAGQAAARPGEADGAPAPMGTGAPPSARRNTCPPPPLVLLRYFFALESPSESEDSTAMNASCGTSTLPTIFIRFLPSFCFSSSFRLREMSPP